ncbi:Beta-glucanase [Pseudolycoriella hygida]|uniref:Beta-glucanase n=1 Tax=Pseudolycoriella hygida TaxID=35572 RepID=A0A9Q0N729_9DIPT|nr:Beta-glucanase [Pseudolycoriella hygida]
MIFVLIGILSLSAQVYSGRVVWSDEFSGRKGQAPDSSKWKYDIGGEGWGNQELEYYTNSVNNAALDGNGNLVITARRENNNNFHCWYGRCQYTSARILTLGKSSHKYGAIEARIKIPKGNGIWPAFWMLGDDLQQVGWPKCGEIDIMENIGKEPFEVHGTLHGPGYSGGDGLTSTYRLPNKKAFGDDFHVYRTDWTSNSISFSVDGHRYVTKTPADTHGKPWVFTHNFFIIFNLAVGGGWPGPPDASTRFPQSMVIDYVRVYSLGRQGAIQGLGDQCVDVLEAGQEGETLVQISNCNGSESQNWTLYDDDGTIRAFDKCLDVSDTGTANDTIVQISDCNGNDSQKWELTPSGDITNGNYCLEVIQTEEKVNTSRLQLWGCNGNANQKWKLMEEIVDVES